MVAMVPMRRKGVDVEENAESEDTMWWAGAVRRALVERKTKPVPTQVFENEE